MAMKIITIYLALQYKLQNEKVYSSKEISLVKLCVHAHAQFLQAQSHF